MADSGGGVTVFRHGWLQDRFARRLADVSPPTDADDGAIASFQKKLEKMATTLRDAAIADYEAALRVARDHEIVNQWVRNARSALRDHRPAKRMPYRLAPPVQMRQLVTGRSFHNR
ncbi:MAG: hypothetical protein ABEN55_22325 [Bradymonadaceae bacterium]